MAVVITIIQPLISLSLYTVTVSNPFDNHYRPTPLALSALSPELMSALGARLATCNASHFRSYHVPAAVSMVKLSQCLVLLELFSKRAARTIMI